MLSVFNDLKPVECHPHLCLRSISRVHHPRIDFSTTLATYFRSVASAKIPPIALTFRLSPLQGRSDFQRLIAGESEVVR